MWHPLKVRPEIVQDVRNENLHLTKVSFRIGHTERVKGKFVEWRLYLHPIEKHLLCAHCC